MRTERNEEGTNCTIFHEYWHRPNKAVCWLSCCKMGVFRVKMGRRQTEQVQGGVVVGVTGNIESEHNCLLSLPFLSFFFPSLFAFFPLWICYFEVPSSHCGEQVPSSLPFLSFFLLFIAFFPLWILLLGGAFFPLSKCLPPLWRADNQR